MALPSDTVRIRVRSAQNEAEVEADLAHIREAIELIPTIVAKFPAAPVPATRVQTPPQAALPPGQESAAPGELPSASIDKGDSLGDILSKFFADQWGRSPRRLSDVREVLQSYGLNYPKQSVAVALLRLAKGSKIRRFKSTGGEFVYTASTLLITPPQGPLDVTEAVAETQGSANV